MTGQTKIEPTPRTPYGPLVVSGHGPFDGLGLIFGGAIRADKPSARTDAAGASTSHRRSSHMVLMTILTGSLSVLLYFLLYEFQTDIVQLADLTRHGVKIDSMAPIAIALVFSLVHGAFTEHFWALLGLKPKHHRVH